MSQSSLSRQIAYWMAATSILGSSTVFFGYYFGFWVVFIYFPTYLDFESWFPTGVEYLLFLIFGVPGVICSWVVAFKIAGRILEPLSSLAENARKIADGDLKARASSGNTSSLEIKLLVEDFNNMARQLQDDAENMTAWNAAVAHELRTPLTILKGRLQGAVDDVLPLSKDQLRGLLLHVDGLARLVDDLRTVTLADGGRLHLLIAPSLISDEASMVVETMRHDLEEAGFEIALELANVTADADPMRIRQALLALLTNALHHATPGRLVIRTISDGRFARIAVEDSGPGLPPEFVRRAFDPFSRAAPSKARSGRGSGLGLSVVRAIAMAHGGQLRYHRSSWGGSIFEITIPAAQSQSSTTPPVEQP
jgi:two-component system, OmpR family, sensor histidine kinase AdeS